MITLALAGLSYVRVSSEGLTYRNPEIWSNVATLALTSPGAPEWRSQIPPLEQSQPLATLADQYAAYATSDAVIASLQRQGLLPRKGAKGPPAEIAAGAVPSPLNGQPTPMLTITGAATSPAKATRLTTKATDAFIAYARSRQDAALIPENQRVELTIVKRSGVPTLTAPRSKTHLIIVFLAGLTATLAAAFVRENSQRGRRQPGESVPTINPVGEPEPQVLNGSESAREAAQQVSHTRKTEAPGGSQVPTITVPRRSVRSSR